MSDRDIHETPRPEGPSDDHITLRLVAAEQRAMRKQLDAIDRKLDEHYVRQAAFDLLTSQVAELKKEMPPAGEYALLKAAVLGCIGLILVGFILILIGLAWRGGGHVAPGPASIAPPAWLFTKAH